MIKLTTRRNKIDIEYSSIPANISIKYTGAFVGELIGNCNVLLTRNEIFIAYTNPPENVFMYYEGNIVIVKAEAYDQQGNIIDTEIKTNYDKWSNVLSGFSNKNKSKWTDYDEKEGYEATSKTIISYKLNNKNHYLDNKGKNIKLKDSMEFKKLNTIRGKYGIE